MGLIDQLRELALRIAKIKDSVQTDEATKNAMIMPFIQILGYNVFDPLEVTPELIADVGTKKGEKVDYAILKDNKIISRSFFLNVKKLVVISILIMPLSCSVTFTLPKHGSGFLPMALHTIFLRILSNPIKWMKNHFLNSISWSLKTSILMN